MIRLESIRKEYDDVIAVKNLSLQIDKGDIFGLIGPNGAGKTTTMKMMVGLLEPTRGQVLINNQPITQDPTAIRRIIGYMPDFFSLYDELKVWEYLDFFADAYEVKNKSVKIDEVIGLMDLTAKKDDFIANLSRGMKQRLAIGKTLLHNPDILVLDEPAAGLDPKARIELRDIIKNVASTGRTTIISSHILTELSDICNTIGVMEKGVMVESGRIDDIIARVQGKKILRLEALGDKEQILKLVKTLPQAESAEIKGEFIDIGFSGKREDMPLFHKKLVEQGVQVVSFCEYKQNLEELFMTISKQEVS